MRKAFLAIALLLCLLEAGAQPPARKQVFTVISLPDKLNYPKERLNQEIASCKTKEEVRALIKSKQLNDAYITFSYYKTPTQPVKWTIHLLKQYRETEDDLILVQSKGLPASLVTDIDKMGDAFKDTLLLLQPLGVAFRLKNPRYPPDQFALRIQELPGKEISIPLQKDSLMLPPALFPQTGSFYHCALFNKNYPQRTLAVFTAGFLSDEQLSLLKDVYRFQQSLNTGASAEELMKDCRNFAALNFGPVHYKQFQNWILNLNTP